MKNLIIYHVSRAAFCLVGLFYALPHVSTFSAAFYRWSMLDQSLLIAKCLVTANTALAVSSSLPDILSTYFARVVVAVPFMGVALVCFSGSGLLLRLMLGRFAAAPKPQEAMISSR